VNKPFLIIGGGLSGLAAAIRFARFNREVLVLEKHHRPGGLNSYYYRHNRLFETGLHAITNYAAASAKKAPLNRLLRQLKIPRDHLHFHQQIRSEIIFKGCASICFSNDFKLIEDEIASKFPHCREGFHRLVTFLESFDPFAIVPFRSARQFLEAIIPDRLLIDILLCPLMYYGSSIENDMDLGQFAIMFRAIFLEGLFRPGDTIKEFLDLLLAHYRELGGEYRTGAEIINILQANGKIEGVELSSGETIRCRYLLSTIGAEETLSLLGRPPLPQTLPRLGFIETIFELEPALCPQLPADRTIIFFNDSEKFQYRRPLAPADFASGVICFPQNFDGIPVRATKEIRSTHLASYDAWKSLSANRREYDEAKAMAADQSLKVLEGIVGAFSQAIVFRDTFTPLTIERYTAKKEGAIYGCPQKIKDGVLGYENLFLAGTDQGFLGIVGSMLSGVSMVNQHILPRF
jgi:phytoene dehydrogenase-like protein